MTKFLSVVAGILRGQASIDYIKKTPISRTPGDVTEVRHN